MSIGLLEVYSSEGQQNSDYSLWAVDGGIKTPLTGPT